MSTSYLNKINGLNYIKFKQNSPFLIDFPMFLIPLEIIAELQLDLIREIGEKKTSELFFELGRLQANYALKKYHGKFKINPDIKNINFYLEQSLLSGMGYFEILDILNGRNA